MDFDEIADLFRSIEGMTSEPSAHLFDLFLDAQHIPGPILEIGPYKGKSAIVLAAKMRPGEHLDLVDIHAYLDKSAFERFGDAVRLHIGDSESLESLLPAYRAMRGSYRFIHTDASHTFDNVVNDLRHVDFLLREDGIVAVDDYENPNYPQVPLAVGAAVYRDKVALSPFLIANNKAYLCRPSQRNAILRLMFSVVAPALLKRCGFILACTDSSPHAPITLRRVEPGEEGQTMYGPELFGPIVEQVRSIIAKE